jgi:hypothetical protein
MRRLLTFLATSLALGAAACDDGVALTSETAAPATDIGGGIWAGTVAAVSAPGGVALANNTTRRVHYIALEPGLAARALWGPCTTQPGCPTLEPGARRTLRAADVAGADATHRDVLFYWWHPVAGRDGAVRADSIRVIATRLGD